MPYKKLNSAAQRNAADFSFTDERANDYNK